MHATCASATDNGGQVFVPAMEVPGQGHMAGIMDPTGAHFFVWQPLEHTGAQAVNDPNQWVWNELITPDPEKAMPFYSALFGWRYEAFGEDNGCWMMYARGEHVGGGVMSRSEDQADIPPNWSVYFNTPDIDETSKRVNDLGGAVHVGPFEMAAGRMSVCQDPLGAWFNVIATNMEVDE